MEFQKTIKKETELKGIGLHTGRLTKVRFLPSPVNSGINFVRIDLPGRPIIPAHVSKIIDLAKSPRRTSIGNGEVEVHTIEHLMAALLGLGIDNIIIEIDGSEIPGLDGSALPFLEILEKAGIQEQTTPKKIFQLKEPIWIGNGGANIVVLPSSEFKVSYTLSYNHTYLKAQYLTFDICKETFIKEIAPSRTFCLEEEVETLRGQGLGKGADYENTLVIGENGIIKNKLRFEDEFARHKILDLLGDLYLLGCGLRAHVIAIKSGHPLNIRLLKRLGSQKEKFDEGGIRVTFSPPEGIDVPLDVSAIQKILPHRYPFLFVDKIIELEQDRWAVGIKNVTGNDYFFQGHFPDRPIMPGVLIIEAMAQVAGVLMLSKKENQGKLAYFMSIDNVKFRRTVVPGDQLRLEVEVVRLKSRTGQVHTRALVGSKIVAEADLMFALVEA